MRLTRVLNITGAVSCTIGSFFALISLMKGTQARELRNVRHIENLTDLKSFFSLVPILVAVTGRVWAARTLKCELGVDNNNDQAAIVNLREEKKSETRTESVGWLSDASPLRETVRETPWALVDSKGPFQVQLPIEDGYKARGDYYQVSGDQFIPAPEGIVDVVVGQLVGHKVLGVRRIEYFLPVETTLTAVGELVEVRDIPGGHFKGAFRENGKTLVLRQPKNGPFLLSRRQLPDLISAAEATSAFCSKLASGMLTVGAGLLLLSAFYNALAKRREKEVQRRSEAARARREAARSSSNGSGAAAADGGGGSAGLCVVCLVNGSEMVYPGCGHLCVCSNCATGRSSVWSRCPICRSQGHPIRVYIT